MVATYFKVTEITTPTPDLQGVYKTAGIYNSTNYYKEMGHTWCIWFNNGNYKFIISANLGQVTQPFFMNSAIGVIEGTYLPQLGASGSLGVTKVSPDVYRPLASNQLILAGAPTIDFTPNEIHFAWVRWIYASINKHFDDRKSKYNLYIEGDERTQSDEAEFAELRIDGPFILIPQKGLYYLDVEINVLTQTHLDPRKHYLAQEMVGTFAKAFSNIINVYKYGDGPLDDGSLLGCLHLQRDLRETIDINYYGIIKEDVKLTQSTIEGHYRLELWSKGD